MAQVVGIKSVKVFHQTKLTHNLPIEHINLLYFKIPNKQTKKESIRFPYSEVDILAVALKIREDIVRTRILGITSFPRVQWPCNVLLLLLIFTKAKHCRVS